MKEEELYTLIEKVTLAVQATIKTTVNGNISRLDEKISTYILGDEAWKRDMEAWQKTAIPVIKAGNNLSDVGGLAVKFFGGVGIIAAGLTAIKYGIITFLK